MKAFKACSYRLLINFRKYCEKLITWFTALKNDWRVAILLISSAIVSLYTNLSHKSNSYYFKLDDVVTREQCDVSSSIVSMEPLLKIEQILVQALNEHANKLQEKVDEIRSGISAMRKQREIYNVDAEEFLSRPLHSFPMLRRLKHEWKAWLDFMQEPLTNEFAEIIRETLNNLNDFDLTPSAEGVQHLCELYDIEPNNWIDGKLQLAEFDIPFTTLDCYAIAFLLYKQDKYQAANTWFEAALKSFKKRLIYNYMIGFSRTDIYESYVENLLKQNHTDIALELITNAIKMDPKNSKLAELKTAIEHFNISLIESGFEMHDGKHGHKIKRGCRGDFIEQSSSSLYCFYNWSTNDFVRLAPFKVELLHDNPIVMLYHEILNETELSDLKVLAKQELKKVITSVHMNDSWGANEQQIGTSKNVWVSDEHNDLLISLNQRLESMTGLSTFDSNVLMGNYGLGGCSTAHTDCAEICEDSRDDSNCDGRLATVLIYLTDVKSGGSTIFPELNVGVYPQKGSALFWYNLHNDMNTCDGRTLHMACPVVVGSKWFLIKWINFKNQMFLKPCLA